MGSRWALRWEITIRWDDARHSPWHTTRYHTIVDTPAQLRRLVEAARADVHVASFRYTSIRQLVGERPATCPSGHEYSRAWSATRDDEWVPCRCGGHHVRVCRAPGCPTPRLVDPVVAYDCDADVPS
jgi:hypothetical protein